MLTREQLGDVLKLMKVSRKIKNKEDAELKIAVEGSCSIQFFVQIFRYLLKENGIEANIYEGDYNSIVLDVLDETSPLYQMQPKFVLLLTDYRDIKAFPSLLAKKEEITAYVEAVVADYEKMWENLSHIEGVHVFQSNFVLPNTTQLGNLECNYPFSQRAFYQRINEELVKRRPSFVTLVDLEGLASDIGKRNWFDYTGYFSYKAGYKLDYTGFVADLFVKQIEAALGKIKKCLVLDLDNTLWGGVVGDLGWEGIQLDPNDAVGEAYRFFQEYVLKLKERGIILAVASKNEEENAKEPFLYRKEMRLHLEDISCFVVNWNDKAENMDVIAQSLNIGTDSLVFFDDNPVERERVRQVHPEICVIEVPKEPENYVMALEEAHAFDWVQLTKEDLERTNTYVQNKKRQELKHMSGNYEEFLDSLEMTGECREIEQKEMERFTQLIMKSNQFNLRTKRYTEKNIETFRKSDQYRCLAMTLNDRFGAYGIISSIILKKQGEYCFIDTWLMSCRVLKRGVEQFVFQEIVSHALDLGCTLLVGEYIETKKNKMVAGFYEELGFQKTEPEKLGWQQAEGQLYVYSNLKKMENNTHIKKG